MKHSSEKIPAFSKGEGMDLLLWRHAEADEGENDLQRPLTARGQRQAAAMAAWLSPRLPKDLRILASPAVRTQQTAQALQRPFETNRALGIAASVPDLIAAAAWPSAGGAVLLIGHQPTLGRLAALLLAGQEADWTIKKGALWWFTNRVRKGETQTVLRAVMPAEMA